MRPSTTEPAASSDELLASSSDLTAALLRFAGTRDLRSSHHRSDERTARAALYNLVLTLNSEHHPPAPPVAQKSGSLAGEAEGGTQGAVKARARGRSRKGSLVWQRQFCGCGRCRWCVDNARWDRIFNEKFADPAYYQKLTVRQDSSLSGAR